ncbi:MAG: serine--tRNA ligase [Clostridia bacterium]|nr:serine--tRNA ligase [Clostridia bacterium]
MNSTNVVELRRVFDLDWIIRDPKGLEKKFRDKGVIVDCQQIVDMYLNLNELRTTRDRMRNEQKRASAMMRDKTKVTPQIKDTCAQLSKKVKQLNCEIDGVEKQLYEILVTLPNPPADGVCPGGKECNEVIKIYGEKPQFDFEPRDHVTIATDLKLVDYERARKIANEGFSLYTGQGALLEWALLQFFYETHYRDGYTPLFLPVMLNEMCGFTTGQFPKFKDEVYRVDDGKHFLNPTAETGIINFHRDDILDMNELPKRYYAYTPCFRVEAGSSRMEERGMIRTHQFNKVEMIQFAHPDHSTESLWEMLEKAERLMQELGLHYRVSKLAAEDCSYAMATTYDVEVWIPSMGIYKEVSSVSNAYDFQARRGNIRFKDENGKKHFVHTLNASGLATSRVFPAILEQYQTADGRVKVPEVLRKYIPFEYIG